MDKRDKIEKEAVDSRGAVRELYSRTMEKGDCIPRNAACAEGSRNAVRLRRIASRGTYTSTLKETLKQVQGDVFFKALSVFLFILFTLSSTAQTLPDYLQSAGENNPTLQSKYKAYEAALEKLPQVSTLPDPQFSFGYFLRPVETRVGPQRAKFSLTQMFPWFGTLEAQESVAAQYAEVKFQQFLDARNELFLKVKKQYYDIYELQKQIVITKENIELLNSYENLARTRYQNNQTKMVDVIRVEMRKENLQTKLDILEDKLRPMVTEFNALLHRESQAGITVADTLTPLNTDTMAFQRQAVSKNPKLSAIQHKQEAAAREEKVAVKAGMPKLGLGIDYVLVDERDDMTLPDNGKNVLMPMVSATIPIFRQKYRAQKKEAVLKQEQFELEFTGKEEELMADFEMKEFLLGETTDKANLYQHLTERANQALNILTTSYSTGDEAFEELLRMEEELLQYRLNFLEAVTDQHKHKAEIDYLTGKDL